MGPEYQKREKARSSTKVVEAIVSSGDTVSSAADLNGFTVAGLIIPEIDSGDISFQACDTEDGIFVSLVDTSGTPVAIAAGAGNIAVSDATLINALAPWRFIRVVVAAPQAAPRVFKFMVKA